MLIGIEAFWQWKKQAAAVALGRMWARLTRNQTLRTRLPNEARSYRELFSWLGDSLAGHL